MTEDELKELYFEWMCGLVYDTTYNRKLSYARLLHKLNELPFNYILPMDENRESDGIYLRYRFGVDTDIPQAIVASFLDNVPCSMLEMMVALSLRCEEDIMENDMVGNRTGQWFWEMIVSLGLGGQNDQRFDSDYVEKVVERFANRDYKPDGEGGLFTIPNCKYDLRNLEIWMQMNQYLIAIGD